MPAAGGYRVLTSDELLQGHPMVAYSMGPDSNTLCRAMAAAYGGRILTAEQLEAIFVKALGAEILKHPEECREQRAKEMYADKTTVLLAITDRLIRLLAGRDEAGDDIDGLPRLQIRLDNGEMLVMCWKSSGYSQLFYAIANPSVARFIEVVNNARRYRMPLQFFAVRTGKFANHDEE